MASIIFPSGKRSLLDSPIDYTSNNVIKVTLHDDSILIDESITSYSQIIDSELLSGGYDTGGRFLGPCTIIESEFDTSVVLPNTTWPNSSISNASYAVLRRDSDDSLIASFELNPAISSFNDSFTVDFSSSGSISISNESQELITRLVSPNLDRYGYSNITIELLYYDREIEVGTFLTGEPWIYLKRRPIAVTNIFAEGRMPGVADGFYRNGYMLDPDGNLSQGQSFDGSMRLPFVAPPSLPLVIDPAVHKVTSLVCSSSRRNAGNTAYINDGLPQINRVAVFTFITDLSVFGISDPQELSGMFRPSYCGLDRVNGTSSKVGEGLDNTYVRTSADVTRPASTSALTLLEDSERLKGTFLDCAVALDARSLHALENGETIGKNIALEHNTACVNVHYRSQDFGDFDGTRSLAKDRTIESIIQRAIDVQGYLNNGGQNNLLGNASSSAGRYSLLITARHFTGSTEFNINNPSICEIDQTFITSSDNVVGTGLSAEGPSHTPISYLFEDANEFEWFRGSKQLEQWNLADNQFEAPYRRDDGYGPSLMGLVLAALYCNSQGLGLQANDDFKTLAAYTWRYWNNAVNNLDLIDDPIVRSDKNYYSFVIDLFQRDASALYATQNLDRYSEDWSTAEPGVFDFYVSTTGNDSNDGSLESPWRTLQHAAENAPGGTTVGVFPGTYSPFGFNNSNLPPSRSSYTTIKSATDVKPIINNTVSFDFDQDTSFSVSGPIIPVWIILDGFEINQPDPNSNGTRGLFMSVCSEVIIRNCNLIHAEWVYYNSGGNKDFTRGVELFGVRNVTLERCRIIEYGRGIGLYFTQDVTFRQCYVRNKGTSPIQYGVGNSNCLIELCHLWPNWNYVRYPQDPDAFENPHQSAISLRSGDITIRKCVLHGGGNSSGIMCYRDNPRFDNVLYENNLFYDLFNTYALRFYNSGSNIVIRNNTVISHYRKESDPTRNCPDGVTRTTNIRYQVAIQYHGTGTGTGEPFAIYNNIFIGKANFGPAFGEGNFFYGGNTLPGRNINYVPGQSTTFPCGQHPTVFEDGTFFPNVNFDTINSFNNRDNPLQDLVDWTYAPNSPAIGYGDPANQPTDSLGTIDPVNGWVLDNGKPRSSTDHDSGCYQT
jgi:hypothetical protein